MSDAAVAATPSAPAQAGSPKKPSAGSKAGSKKPRVQPAHRRTSEMVIAAIKNLKERGGSTLQAIKKYISANNEVDAEKLAPFIKKSLKSAVTSGSLVQNKGKGASGGFKLSSAEKGESKKLAAHIARKKQAAKKLTKKPSAAKAAKTGKKSALAGKSTAPKSAKKTKDSLQGQEGNQWIANEEAKGTQTQEDHRQGQVSSREGCIQEEVSCLLLLLTVLTDKTALSRAIN